MAKNKRGKGLTCANRFNIVRKKCLSCKNFITDENDQNKIDNLARSLFQFQPKFDQWYRPLTYRPSRKDFQKEFFPDLKKATDRTNCLKTLLTTFNKRGSSCYKKPEKLPENYRP